MTGSAARDRRARLPLDYAFLPAALLAYALLGGGKWSQYADGRIASGDPDDALRLVQIRDWLAGQSWFDTIQHRIDPPSGGDIHWSRLIDAPVGALIRFFDLFTSVANAERLAMLLWPLLLLAGCFWAVDRIIRRTLGEDARLPGMIIAATATSALFQFTPMRIDHHSAQQLCFMLAMVAIIGRSDMRSAILAAVPLGLQALISIEGIAYAAIVGGLLVMQALGGRGGASRLLAFLASLLLTLTAGLALTRGLSAPLASYCDAVSAPYLAAIAAALVVLGLSARWLRTSPAMLIIALVAAGAAGVASLLLVEPRCAAGPFEMISPFLRTHWHAIVLEGLPIWRLPFDEAMLFGIPLLIGCAWTIAAWRGASNARERAARFDLMLVAIACSVLAVVLLRASAIAAMLLLPGFTYGFVALRDWSRRQSRALPQAASLLLALATTPVMLGIILSLADRGVIGNAPTITRGDRKAHAACNDASIASALRGYDRALFFNQMDYGPMILANSGASVLATGHHREAATMERSIRAWIAPAEQARGAMGSATHLIYCAEPDGSGHYERWGGPGSLAGALSRGLPPGWLERVGPWTHDRPQIFRIRPAPAVR